MTTVAEHLRAARTLIAVESNWCHGWGEGKPRRCAVHALKVAGDWPRPYIESLKALQRQAGGFVGTFNDRHTHAEVLDLFDRAIAAEAAA